MHSGEETPLPGPSGFRAHNQAAAKSSISQLLATIFDDDGQYEEACGTERAIRDAIDIVAATRATRAEANLNLHNDAIYTDEDMRDVLKQEMRDAGGLVRWAIKNEIPVSRVSEFNTGRRPASPTILVALGFCRAIVSLSALPNQAKVPRVERS